MSFYNEISKYYDKIFTAGEEQLNFIKEAAGKKEARILDIACGSGTYSVALAKEGYKVTAVDIEEEMIRKLRDKADREKVNVEAFVCSMTELEEKLTEKYQVVFCIGNSLVHLKNHEEIEDALRQMYNLTADDGIIIIQIMNYDRIIKLGLKELPTIINQEEGIKFIRKYDYKPELKKIDFNTTLIVKDGDNVKTFNNTVELLPLLSNELADIVEKAGFRRYECYGDFKASPYKEDSYMLVLKAYR